MNKVILLCLNLLSILTYTVDKNILVVVLMVKNEEPVILQTLEPFVNAGINSFIIFDTGSTDKTVEKIESFLKKHEPHLVAHIFQEPFVDFATSRNRALDLAEQTFPQAKFFVMPDAEWYLNNGQSLNDFCQDHTNDTCSHYMIRIKNETNDFFTPRLIRAHTNARFVGECHEVVVGGSCKKVPTSIYFELGSSRTGLEKSRSRWHRDLQILLKKHQTAPRDSRNLFYLAQTYECLADYENAYKYYKLRSHLEVWREEDYETWYRLGRITTILAGDNSDYTWQEAFDYYCKAHNILPHRAEPLVAIAQYYWPDFCPPVNIPLCYLFAKRACEFDYPKDDILFIDPVIYNFKRYELLSKSAWHLGDFELGEKATRMALGYQESPHLLHNLNCYIESKNKL